MKPLINKFAPDIQSNIDHWLNENYDASTKNEIRKMLKENSDELINAFYTSLKFGTGGLRGIMGVGPNRVNKYTIRAVTQGLSDYINSMPAPPDGHIILIGYDTRHHSKDFAEEAAKVFAGNHIQVLLFNEFKPTPLVSFGCRFKKCSAAIMITASHNPPQYNGYKIYWNDGAQVPVSQDLAIIKMIDQVDDLNKIKSSSSLETPLIDEIDDQIEKAYLEYSSRLQNYSDENSLNGSQLKIVYTSLHGTGISLMPQILSRWGFTNVHFVDEQIIPDGDFPSAPIPNPENPDALKLGIQKLNEIKGDLLIATDPDADRIGIAFRDGEKITTLNGNQIAALLLNHICYALSSKNKLAANAAFIKTFVTTELFQAIADYYQKPCFNVLPGFKNIAEKIRQWEIEPRGHQFIFGAEESHGYLYGTLTRDKDAIAIGALICEMVLHAKLQGRTINDLLLELYKSYGVFDEQLHCMIFMEGKEGRVMMAKSMELLRRFPPTKISGTNVLRLEDFAQSIKIDFITHKLEPLQQPKSNLLLFWLEDGSKLAIRPSGTEPIIKIHCCVQQKQFKNIDEALKNCKERASNYAQALENILKENV